MTDLTKPFLKLFGMPKLVCTSVLLGFCFLSALLRRTVPSAGSFTELDLGGRGGGLEDWGGLGRRWAGGLGRTGEEVGWRTGG